MPADQAGAAMETLLGSVAFTLFVAAQVLPVITVQAAQTEDRCGRSSCEPDDHRTRFIWQSGT
jgi:hypothetical protein